MTGNEEDFQDTTKQLSDLAGAPETHLALYPLDSGPLLAHSYFF